jgi:hypothetical protein
MRREGDRKVGSHAARLQSVTNINGMAITGRLIKEAPGFPYRHPDQIVRDIY